MGTPRFEPDVPLDPYRSPVDWTPYALPPAPSAWKRWGRNLLLFLLTAVSVFVTWVALHSGSVSLPDGRTLVALDILGGLRITAALLAILLAHEMGHYLACRRYGVDATLPFFLPLPVISLVGTLGAFIRIRTRIPNRKALFDIGVAGPLAGFVVCLPVLLLGMREARLTSTAPTPDDVFFGEPLLFQAVARLVHGHVPDTMNLVLGPLGLAAWFGLFMTALNLIPIGQLDGGHLTYAIFRDKAAIISRVCSWIAVALIYFGPSWILWAILVRVLGRGHPPTTYDDEAVGRGRALIGILSLVVFVVCFVPDPIIWSWQDTFEAFRKFLHR